MQLDDKALADILLKGNYISAEDLKTAQDFALKKHGTFLDYFFSAGLLNRDLLGQAIAESLGILYADLNTNIPTLTQIAKIPVEIAQKYRLVLFAENSDHLVIASDQPKEAGVLEELTKIFPTKKFILAYSLTEDIDAILSQYRKPLETRFSKIIAEQKFMTLIAKNGEEGLTLAFDNHPDLILLDIIMPKMDGIAMLKKLRLDQWGKDVPVIILSNLSDADKNIDVVDGDVQAYLVKSDFPLADIVAKIKEIIK